MPTYLIHKPSGDKYIYTKELADRTDMVVMDEPDIAPDKPQKTRAAKPQKTRAAKPAPEAPATPAPAEEPPAGEDGIDLDGMFNSPGETSGE